MACHRPPRAVAIPRAFNASAMARSEPLLYRQVVSRTHLMTERLSGWRLLDGILARRHARLHSRVCHRNARRCWLRRWCGHDRLGFGIQRLELASAICCTRTGRLGRHGRDRFGFGIQRRDRVCAIYRGFLFTRRSSGAGRSRARKGSTRVCFPRRHNTLAGELTWLGSRRNRWTAMVFGGEQRLIVARCVLMLGLQSGGGHMLITRRSPLLRRRLGSRSARAAVEAGSCHSRVVNYRLVIVIRDRDAAKIVDRPVVGKPKLRPVRLDEQR
jgi:hypothetical protein